MVALTASQLACMLEGIDWRNPQYSWRPASAGYAIIALREAIEGDSLSSMAAAVSPHPDDVEALKALLAAAVQRADEAEVRAANA